MRILVIFMLVLLASIQYRLWYGAGGVLERRALSTRVHALENQTRTIQTRNHELRESLIVDAPGSQNALSKVEIYARHDLGLIKENEIFYWVIEEEE